MSLQYTNITSLQLNDLLVKHNNKVFIVDIRTPAEFSSGHIKGAFNIPLDVISFDKLYDIYDEKFAKDNSPIVFHCRSGARSLNFLSMAKSDKSYDESLNISFYHLKDGILEWVGSGYSIEV